MPNDDSAGQQARDKLEKELSLIQAMPEAILQDHKSSYKSGQALVGNNYSTELGYRDIRGYYDRELSKYGWKLKSEESLTDWGRDFGGKEVEYCKGEYAAGLTYAGKQTDYGWTYALDLSWGLSTSTCG